MRAASQQPLRCERATALLNFWFDGAGDDADIRPGHPCYARWFGAATEVDAVVRDSFAPDMHAARGGARAHWRSPLEALALVLLLDQVPRHVYRGQAAAFASDDAALALAHRCLAEGLDAELSLVQGVFLLLPMQHAERWSDHAGVIERLEGALRRARHGGLAIAGFLAAALRAEREHQAELERFGRYPGRNAALGRVSTPTERDYLLARPAIHAHDAPAASRTAAPTETRTAPLE